MRKGFRSPMPRPLGLWVTCLFAFPLLLTACAGGSSPTATIQPQATTDGGLTRVAPTSATRAPQPAATTSGAIASRTTATAIPVQNLTLPPDARRGAGDNLRLIWWQAPTILNPHLSQGTKDFDAARPVIEPLAVIFRPNVGGPDIPVLAKEIPSIQNGELAADGTSVTWKLREGVVWSDGAPFTADDVIFTWNFIKDPKNGATTAASYQTIKAITASDPTTVTITFAAPTPVWYLPFVGTFGGILPKHILSACADAKQCPFNQNPIGTGPYVVTDFTPGDTVRYKANDTYRESNAPYFATVEMKGGGDAVTALRAVQTGQADFAWNPQVAPEILKQFTDSGNVLAVGPGGGAENIYINFADPSIAVNGEKSSPQSKNPFWTDKNVRQALALAIDRQAMADNLYGPAGRATNSSIPTVWDGPDWQYDPKQANALLNAAGWKMGNDDIREKDGKKFAITLRTSVNAVRDKESQLIKSNLKDVGIAVDLRPVDAGVFFGQPDNPDNLARFQTDLEMYADAPESPDMQSYLAQYTTDNITTQANGWKSPNVMRWSNADYDATIQQLTTTLDQTQRIELSKRADTILIGDYAFIPLVARRGLAAYTKGLIGVNHGAADSNLWNIAHWTKP